MESSIVFAEAKHIEQIFQIEQSEILIPWSKDSISNLVDNKNIVFRVLVSNDLVLGYYSFAKVFNEGHINNIAVLYSEQSKGYGSMLMQDMIDVSKTLEINELTLEVETGNVKALGLYEKFGFKNEGLRKKYYKNTYDAIIMWRR